MNQVIAYLAVKGRR